MIIAVLPAHNEAVGIQEAIASVRHQTLSPDEILVVCDNCTDDTAALAAASGARVTATVSNTAKKAGALNQALAREISRLANDDYVLIMDADSVLDPTLIDAAVRYLDGDSKLGGVSGTFRGGCGGGFVGWLQRNEYARYARDVRRLKGKALVLRARPASFESRR